MASLYERPNSPFLWIKYRDPVTGKIVRKSTQKRADIPSEKREAKAMEADYTRKEMSVPRTNNSERWESWAEEYFRQRYPDENSTGKGARLALRDILAFFRDHEIVVPRQVTYEVANKFVPWRLSGKTLDPVHPNTARLRFVFLSVLMGEAVRRGFATGNPCREVKVNKVAAKVKPEITTEDQFIIEAALIDQKEWMREQWLILMRQGCRIAETKVPMDRIDEKMGTITFRLKGGKLHTAPLHPDLLPLVARARAEKRATLVQPPPSDAQIWLLWLQKLGLPYSIHCTRVTVITRLLRAGHGVAKVAAFIGHSEEIQVIYRRLTPPDVHDLLATLGDAATRPSAGSPSPRTEATGLAPAERDGE